MHISEFKAFDFMFYQFAVKLLASPLVFNILSVSFNFLDQTYKLKCVIWDLGIHEQDEANLVFWAKLLKAGLT